MPVIAVAVAAPAHATSTTDCTTVKSEVAVIPPTVDNYTSGYERTVTEWQNTTGAPVLVTFDIAGGGGGVNYNAGADATSEPGGSGERLKGTILVPSGAWLTLIAGNGGIGIRGWGSSDLIAGTVVRGGEGYGTGGNLTMGAGVLRYGAGSGGGGSAILLGQGAAAKPLVVAGGGGGGGGGIYGPKVTMTNDSKGGDGGTSGTGSTEVVARLNSSGILYRASGGGSAVGATPGQPAVIGAGNGTRGSGIAGSANVAGLVGGAGASAPAPPASANTDGYTPGGGGGGYAGGASGNWTAIGTNDGMFGGGGGGGSSYVANVPGITVNVTSRTLAGNGTQTPLTRSPGWAGISYGTCVPAPLGFAPQSVEAPEDLGATPSFEEVPATEKAPAPEAPGALPDVAAPGENGDRP